MDGRTTLAALLAVGAATMAWGKPTTKSATAKAPTTLHLRAFDRSRRLLLVEVTGLAKAPPSNYFTMTDERDRHYVAQSIHCDAPAETGVRACELEIPSGYERHPLKALELHLRGLHGRVVAASADEIKAAWAAPDAAAASDSADTAAPAPPDMAH